MSSLEHASNRLSQIAPDDAPQKIGRGYTVFVKSMRVLLPLSAIAMLAVLILWPETEKAIEPIRKDELFPQANFAENELINPRYESADKNLNPFIVTADTATQTQDNPDLIYLNAPIADIALKNGGQLDVRSQDGIYAQKDEKLSLKGDVELIYDKTYTLQGHEMRVDLRTRQAFSDQDVVLKGPTEMIEAKGVEALTDQGRVIFKGPGKLTLYPKNNKKNDKQDIME